MMFVLTMQMRARFDTGNINITPVKNGEFRTLPISQKLMHMLKLLQNDSQYVFQNGKLDGFREGLRKHRVKLAVRLGEQEILHCSFKTFRTFYGTKMSYILNDPFEIQYRMEHTQLNTTLKYIRRTKSMNRLYTSIVTRTVEEAQNAVDQGCSYVTDVEDIKLWKKPK